MSDENDIHDEQDEKKVKSKIPSLLRNYISFVGVAIVVARLASIALLVLIEMTSPVENAYIGILT